MVMLWAPELEDMEEEVKWAGHYSSSHEILLVGEGDFSFSLSLAKSFGSGTNIVATSLDSHDAVVSKYSNARSNLAELSRLGATVLHKVDATRMRLDPDLRHRRFDRIVFNFPHAGFKGREDNPALIGLHRKLVQGFLRNAKGMVRQGGYGGGEVHVNHKMGATFCQWDLPGLARGCGLAVVAVEEFRAEDYPGYRNKRGDGARADQPFPLGECCTFMFIPVRPEKKRRCGAAGRVVEVDVGLYGMEKRAGPEAPYAASFGDYLPAHDDMEGSCWSIQVRSPARPAARSGLTPLLASWPSPPPIQQQPLLAAARPVVPSIWSPGSAAAPGYFQRAYEDEVLARCERLLDLVHMFDGTVEDAMRTPGPPSSNCRLSVQQPRRGDEAADNHRDPYWIY